ncbi:MAG: hypothetical protein SWH78_08830 [Thermodesulfobacteriota bacterium]|nr:hypothetical protein [Thermodesulfobacteriota bacterium]
MHTRTKMLTMMALSVVALWGFAAAGFTGCAWAQGPIVTASNGSVVAGTLSRSSKWMSSHTSSGVTATAAPSLDHSNSTSGIGDVSVVMIATIQQGGGSFNQFLDRVQQNHESVIPNLFSTVTYRQEASASGVIDKFNAVLHYHSNMPDYQVPEPWFVLQ